MKWLKSTTLISAATLALALTGCAKDDLGASLGFSTTPIEISGGIESRATTEGFEDGDKVGIYVVNYDGSAAGELIDSGNQADNALYTFNESEDRWVSMGSVYYKDDKTAVDIYGYYPSAKPASVSAFEFEVEQDQSAPAENEKLSGYEASDFLWGKAESITPSENAVQIPFGHMMACAEVVLTEGTGFEAGEFDNLSRSLIATGVTRKSTINLSTGLVSPSGEADNSGAAMLQIGENTFRAIVVPQDVAKLTSMFSITLDGIVYKFKKDTDFSYIAGEVSQFTIVVNKKSLTGTYELELGTLQVTPWTIDNESYAGEARQYYTVHIDEPGTLEATLESLNKDGAKIKNLKVTGTIDKRDFDYMKDDMTVLQALNLKEVKIAEYQENSYSAYYPANEIPNQAFTNKSSLYYFAFPGGITRIGFSAFSRSSLTGALIIPDQVTDIGSYAFADCKNITSLSLSASLKILEEGAFRECENFKGKLNLPHGLEYIGDNAFTDCDQFTGTLDLPSTLTYIGSQAFSHCEGFSGSLKIPESVTKLFSSAFSYCSGLRGELILHNNLTFEGEGGNQFACCNFTGELVLPSGITTISSGTFSYNLFSSIAGFPDGLVEIQDGAFTCCWRLSGVLEFPNSLTAIGCHAFNGCRTLEGIILPEHLSIIQESAFNNCFYLNKIVSKSLVPPVAIAGAFDGVSKNNFTVEVPSRSVNSYQQADEWGLFERISAYEDFSIDRQDTRWLNAGGSETLYVKALVGAEWEVESKPDWVTVEPMNGSGKVEVTLTTGELAQGSADRTGEIIFKLKGTEYTQKTEVTQYDYEYGDGDVVTLQTATKGDGVDIVIMGDCYDAYDISEGQYLENINEAYGHLFTVEPYKTYKDYFNVYGVFGLSKDSGMGTINLEKEAKFGCQYFTAHGITSDSETVFEYACKAPIDNKVNETVIIVVPNTTEYAGITQMWGDGSAIAICPMSSDAYPYDFRGLVQHEAGGHGFGKLGDEYIYTHYWIDQNCTCDNPHDEELRAGQAKGWFRNLSLSGDVNNVGWSHLIFHPDYANIVDVYEGGFFHTKNVWRSEPNSCMNNNIPYFSAISRQEIVERIKSLAGEEFDINDFYANDVKFMNPVTKSAILPETIQRSPQWTQHAPKYMGDKPTFKTTK